MENNGLPKTMRRPEPKKPEIRNIGGNNPKQFNLTCNYIYLLL